ncbi:MAG: winged helix-turn-helix domain-containing protein [Kordiimonadaceae bacterium]|nr:winged helix-turn-helix domain-containing protein [Kordiimonadaceae bacterium]
MAKNDEDYSVKIRVLSRDELAMGPGKADLLDQIIKTGSIAAAGRAMNMSYKRAWDLVETMNNCFKTPVVEKSKGGAAKGGAVVTPFGKEILDQYRSIQKKAHSAIKNDVDDFQKFLKHQSNSKKY